MTQALINSTNTQNNSINLNDGSIKSESLNFDQILTKQTDSIKNLNNDNFSQKTDILPNQTEDLSNELNQTVEESSAEAVIDLVISNNIYDMQENISIISNSEDQEENTNDEETNIDSNITEEDPTMYNELDTLKNPTVSILMHTTQITQLPKTSAEDSQDIKTDELSEQNNNDSDILLTKDNLLKQFDSKSEKNNIVFYNTKTEKPQNENNNEKNNNSLNKDLIKDLNIKIIDSDNQTNNYSDNLMQNQTPQEQVAKVIIQGNIKYDKIESTVQQTIDIKPTTISTEKIIEQITKQLDGMYNNSKLNIILNPEKLGKVNLQLLNSKNGLTAQFTVSTQETRELLLKGIDGLKESLLAQGINIDNVSVKLEDGDAEYNPDWTEQENSNSGYKQQHPKKEKENKKPFEQMMFEIENNDTL